MNSKWDSCYDRLKVWARQMCIEHPQHAAEIRDIFILCRTEIEEGGSVSHEVDLATSDIKRLIGE